MSSPVVEFFFDCSSPWTYLAFEEVQRVARETGAAIEWRPILVGGVFNAMNPSQYEARRNRVAPKEAYVAKDLADWAGRYALRIVWPPAVFPVNSVSAMRGCLVAARNGRLVEHARAVFEAYWRDDLDISKPEVLDAIRARCGLDRDDYFAGIADPEIKAQLRRNVDELIARGGFGSPTTFVAGIYMYFGNDRMPLVRDAILKLGQ